MSLSDKHVEGFREIKGGKFSNITHDEYHDKKAKTCGCGFDCCDNVIHTVDHETHERVVVYVKNGVLVTETYQNYITP